MSARRASVTLLIELITLRVTLKVERCQDGGCDAVHTGRRCVRSRRGRRGGRSSRRGPRPVRRASAASGTTIDAIAARAGVSRKTVFTSVGGKVGAPQAGHRLGPGGRRRAGGARRPACGPRARCRRPIRSRAVAKWAHAWSPGIAARLALLHPVLTAAADVDEQAAGAQRGLRAQPAGRSQELRRAAAEPGTRSAAT